MNQYDKRARELASELGVTGQETVQVARWYSGPSMWEQVSGIESEYPGANVMCPVLLATDVRVPIDFLGVAMALEDGEDEPETAQEYAEMAYDWRD